MDGDDEKQGAANDNTRSAEAEGSGEKVRRVGIEDLDRLVLDIARLIGRRMAREDHAARIAANDNHERRADRGEPDVE